MKKTRETAGPGAAGPPGEGAPRPGNGAEAAGGDAVEPRKPNKSCKKVYFAVLPDKYEPLLEEEEEESQEERRRRKEGKKTKTREDRKKRRKSVGRALCWTWRCMVAGLQSLAGVYSAPFTATTTLATACSKA